MKVLSRFRRILGSFWGPSRYETARWGARSGTVRRHFVGLERSLAFQTRIVTSTSIIAVKRFIRCRYGDLSWVSSRDVASSGLLCMPTKEVRRSGYADIHGSGSALRRHVLRECSGPHCGAVGSARNRPRGRSRRWICTSAAAQNPRSRDRVRRWRRGSPG